MKICPTCNRSYPDDTLNFCLDDGATLTYVYDQVDSRSLPPTRLGDPAPTEVFNSRSTPIAPPAALVPTMTAMQAPPMYSPRVETAPAPPKRGGRYAPIVIGAIVLVFVGAAVMGGIIWFAQRDDSRSGETINSNAKPSPTSTVTKDDGPWKERNEQASLVGENLTYYPGSTADECQDDCEKNRKCKGFTFIRAGAYKPKDPPMCYLASKVTGMNTHTCCISAVKR